MKYLLLLLLVGCTTNPPSISRVDAKIEVNPGLLVECLPLSLLPANASFEQLLETIVANAEKYADCKAKQSNSIAIIKKLTNKE